MNIDITAKKFELTPTIKEHVEEKVQNFSRFFDDKITEARVTLEVDDGHHRHGKINRCEIIARVPGQKDVFVEVWTEDMHGSINQAAEIAEKELKKIKEKIGELDEEEIRRLKETGFEEETLEE